MPTSLRDGKVYVTVPLYIVAYAYGYSGMLLPNQSRSYLWAEGYADGSGDKASRARPMAAFDCFDHHRLGEEGYIVTGVANPLFPVTNPADLVYPQATLWIGGDHPEYRARSVHRKTNGTWLAVSRPNVEPWLNG